MHSRKWSFSFFSNVLSDQKQIWFRKPKRVNLITRSGKKVTLIRQIGYTYFHQKIKKVIEPVTDTIKITSEDLTKTMILTSKHNNKALEISNDKLREIMNDRCIIASYLLSFLSKVTNTDPTSQFKLVKDPSSNRVNDFSL